MVVGREPMMQRMVVARNRNDHGMVDEENVKILYTHMCSLNISFRLPFQPTVLTKQQQQQQEQQHYYYYLNTIEELNKHPSISFISPAYPHK